MLSSGRAAAAAAAAQDVALIGSSAPKSDFKQIKREIAKIKKCEQKERAGAPYGDEQVHPGALCEATCSSPFECG